MSVTLEWKSDAYGQEAVLGRFKYCDGVRFSLAHYPTCYRRGPWRLLIEVEDTLRTWGCFDEQDQPQRWFHSPERAKEEAQAIADVLVADHERKAARRS